MEKKTAVVIGGPLPKSIPISNLQVNQSISWNKLQIYIFQMVKEGRFGKVYRGTWDEGERKGSYVAIKIFDEFSETIFNHEKRIYDELAKLPKWYPNVLRMLTHGKCPDNKDFWMVLDYHEHLSLFDVLVFTPISITTANRFILTMLDGLQFLHDDRPYFFGHPKPPILHRWEKREKRRESVCVVVENKPNGVCPSSDQLSFATKLIKVTCGGWVNEQIKSRSSMICFAGISSQRTYWWRATWLRALRTLDWPARSTLTSNVVTCWDRSGPVDTCLRRCSREPPSSLRTPSKRWTCTQWDSSSGRSSPVCSWAPVMSFHRTWCHTRKSVRTLTLDSWGVLWLGRDPNSDRRC